MTLVVQFHDKLHGQIGRVAADEIQVLALDPVRGIPPFLSLLGYAKWSRSERAIEWVALTWR
jgi:hypothetical protein